MDKSFYDATYTRMENGNPYSFNPGISGIKDIPDAIPCFVC